MSRTSAARIVRAAGLSRLKALDPPEPDNRYEHPAPGDVLHADIKKLARFQSPGHRTTGDRALGRGAGAVYDYLFIAVDDHARIAFVRRYPDETRHSAADFLDRTFYAMRHLGYPVPRLLTYNVGCFSSGLCRRVYERHRVSHRTTRPYRPRTNGKAERFIQTLLREWSYARTSQTADQRHDALSAWLTWYDERRPHTALNGFAPTQRLPNVFGYDTRTCHGRLSFA